MRKTMYFQYFKFQKGHHSNKKWRKLTKLDLVRMFIRRKWHAKFQLNMSKHVRENGRPGQTDGRTDRHHHTIIRPVWRRAYKNWGRSVMLQIFPRGGSAMIGEDLQCCRSSGERSAMLQIFRGKVCNVADLPGKGLQCCRSSGGNVSNVAEPSGGRSARGRSAIQQTPGITSLRVDPLLVRRLKTSSDPCPCRLVSLKTPAHGVGCPVWPWKLTPLQNDPPRSFFNVGKWPPGHFLTVKIWPGVNSL